VNDTQRTDIFGPSRAQFRRDGAQPAANHEGESPRGDRSSYPKCALVWAPQWISLPKHHGSQVPRWLFLVVEVEWNWVVCLLTFLYNYFRGTVLVCMK
jgi:hypothetical protein